jgi:hypothetical protein
MCKGKSEESATARDEGKTKETKERRKRRKTLSLVLPFDFIQILAKKRPH